MDILTDIYYDDAGLDVYLFLRIFGRRGFFGGGFLDWVCFFELRNFVSCIYTAFYFCKDIDPWSVGEGEKKNRYHLGYIKEERLSKEICQCGSDRRALFTVWDRCGVVSENV